MIDWFMAHVHVDFNPTFPTLITTNLWSQTDENNSQALTSNADTRHPPSVHVTLHNTGLPGDIHSETGHQVTSHLTAEMEHVAHIYADTSEQVKSPFETKRPGISYEHTRHSAFPQIQFPAISTSVNTDISHSCVPHAMISCSKTTYTTPADTSTPLMSLQVEATNTSTGLMPFHHPTVSLSNPLLPPNYQLRGDTDVFTPKSSSTTLYHEIKPSPYARSQNRAPPSSENVLQIAEALAKVTQLQWLPQAKPDIFMGNETDTRFFIWLHRITNRVQLNKAACQRMRKQKPCHALSYCTLVCEISRLCCVK